MAHAAKKTGKPFFLYFASTAPHTPIRPDKPFQGKSGAGLHGRVKERVKDLPADHPIGELYEMQADPGETNNLWDERQDVVKQLLALLEKYQREGRSAPPNP